MKTHFSGLSQGVADHDRTSNAKIDDQLDISDSDDEVEIIPPTPLAKQDKKSKVIAAGLILKNRFVIVRPIFNLMITSGKICKKKQPTGSK